MATSLATASILSVAVAMGLAACGGGSAPEGAVDPSPEETAVTYSAGTEVEIGLQVLLGAGENMKLVIHQLDRVWGKQVSETPGPAADLGQDSDAFDAGYAVGKSSVEDWAADFESGTTTREELLDECYDARSAHAAEDETNSVSWGRGCRAGIEDAIADLG